MIYNLSENNSIANHFIAEIRDAKIQQDSMRFRRNMERIGEVLAYEISKELNYREKDIETPLGVAKVNVPADRVVLATILRAGLPLHQGMLHYFDYAGNAFVSAFRRHHKDGTFDVHMEYVSCPPLDDVVLIVSDPMLATGASMSLSTNALLEYGTPKQIHFATAIASQAGLDHIRRIFPEAYVWMAALDEELTGKAYIVPGLGDAGDLSFGEKGLGADD
ncbi:MAG: uracil phosphoribosyltransferase [Phaeodactylibacter sp.]|nr:uracil phosphoribosyltransferase [Phaeodactylibacter sp.]MCB9048387.1 uracil phosphoribosyltransferase [Lewinellaceae bacterium]